MPQAPNPIPSVVDDLRRLRLGGHAAQALQLASRALQADARNWDIMGEAIRILICLGEADSAANLYQTFAAGRQANRDLEPEVLVRLALLLERRDLLTDMEPPAGPSWLVALLNSGTDAAETLVIQDLQIRIKVGHPLFIFAGTCPHCGHSHRQEFRNTLLVHRTWLCTSCFGQVRLDHRTAREALQDKYSRQLADGLQNTDQQLIEHIKPRLMGQVPAPSVVQALGQGYHFILNELVLRYAADAQPEAGVAP